MNTPVPVHQHVGELFSRSAAALPLDDGLAERECAVSISASALGKKVLCVDDNEAVLDLIATQLAAYGFQVSQAARGREGLEFALSEPVDIVVLDFGMPDLDGGTVAAEIKRRKPGIPIILYSGHGCEALTLAPGVVDGYVQKGGSPRCLVAELNRLLDSMHAGTRRFPRFPMQASFAIEAYRGGEIALHNGKTLNLCEGGLGAVVEGDLQVDEIVGIKLKLPHGSAMLVTSALVCYRIGGSCGLEFLLLTPADQNLLRRCCEHLAMA